MRTEAQTPIEQRFLWLEGFISPTSLALIKNGLGGNLPVEGVVCFVGFSYADLPVPKRFDVVFDVDDPSQWIERESRITRVTQQMGTPDEIPHGWKTICVVEFPSGIPDLVAKMPTVDSWHQSKLRVGLCDKQVFARVAETLKAIK